MFERYCASCHTQSSGKKGALRHFDMSSYPFAGHHAGEIAGTIRAVLGAGGGEATMPKDKPGAVQGEELRLILRWAEAYDRAHAGAQTGNDHDHDH